MAHELENLTKNLELLEDQLDHAYVEYAKKIDNISSSEMKIINALVDRIIQTKQEIQTMKGTLPHDKNI